MFDFVTFGIRQWIADLFAAAIKQTSRPQDRNAAIQWLLKSREILDSDISMTEKLKALNALISSKAAVSAIAASIAEAVKHYRTSKMPLSMKIAMPATLAAMPLVGMHGAGIVAFGGGIGLPVLLLIFLGTAGITSVIETVATNPNSATGIATIVSRILQAEASRRAKADFRRRMAEEAAAPTSSPMPAEEAALRESLLRLDPLFFEKHVMALFDKAGLEAVVTPRAKDYGLDGYALHSEHPDKIIVVQCKRYVPPLKVGFGAIQNFKTVMTDSCAFRGYVVTTSSFTAGAVEYADSTPGMILIDMDALVLWHKDGVAIDWGSGTKD